MFGCFHRNLSGAVRTSTVVELYLLQNPSKLLLPSLRYISSSNITNQEHSFTVSYLINSCGLSPQSAFSASKNVHFETPNKPDLVLSFFRSHGFSQQQISNLIKRCPKLLLCNLKKNLSPKLDFFHSKGLSSSDIVKILSSNPRVLQRSLKNVLVPNFNFLKGLLQSDEKTLTVVKRNNLFLYQDLDKILGSRFEILRDNGVSDRNIVTLLHYWPRIFIINMDKIKKIVEEAKNMGFNPSKATFVPGFVALKSMSKATWERKVVLYKRWDLSEEEILEAFRNHPGFMIASEGKIMAVMDLFVSKLGWESSVIGKRPILMTFSLEKRLIPRASVLQFLVSKGLIKKNFRSSQIFECAETTFLQKFVNCYKEAHELLKLYGEKLALAR